MSQAQEIRCVWGAGALLGEGPLWAEDERALYWLDIKRDQIHRFEPGSEDRQTWTVPGTVSCLALRAGGGFVAACRQGFARLELESGTLDWIAQPEAERQTNRFNDGKCDTAGRFWAGSIDDEESNPSGALYRLDADGSCARADDGYIITNGPAFSADGRTLYHTSSFERTVFAFDVSAAGELSNKRVFVRIADDAGYPDGMTVDAEDHLWVAHYAGARLTRFAPDGETVRIVPLPVDHPTSCAFGGASYETLYVTSATKDLAAADASRQPDAGGLFALDVGVRGTAPGRYAG